MKYFVKLKQITFDFSKCPQTTYVYFQNICSSFSYVKHNLFSFYITYIYIYKHISISTLKVFYVLRNKFYGQRYTKSDLSGINKQNTYYPGQKEKKLSL